MKSPNETQVGGSHYKSAFQHWDFVKECNLGYLEGNITKYLGRAHKKNGVEDLKKSLHYLDKLMEDVMLNGRRTAWQRLSLGERVGIRLVDRTFWGRCKSWLRLLTTDCAEFAEANDIDCPHVETALRLVTTWGELDEHPLDTLRNARLEIEWAITVASARRQ